MAPVIVLGSRACVSKMARLCVAPPGLILNQPCQNKAKVY